MNEDPSSSRGLSDVAKTLRRSEARLEEAKQRIEELERSEEELSEVREALRQSEAQYRMAFEHTGTAMMIVEEDTVISKANRTATLVTGYAPEELEHKRRWTEFVADEDLTAMLQYHRQRGITPLEVPSEYEIQAIHRSGEKRDVLINVTLIPGTNRSLVSLIDITERKRAEGELQESERRFRETAELLPGIICELDLYGRVAYTNKQALETFGYTQEEYLEGVNALDLIDPEDKGRALTRIQTATRGDYGKPAPYRMRRKDGTVFDAIVTSAPILKERTINGMRSCILDVTDLRRAEDLLRESEERFRGLFIQSPVGIAVADENGTVMEMNRSFAEMFGEADAEEDQELNVFDITGLDRKARQSVLPGESLQHQGWHSEGLAEKGRRFLGWHITGLRSAGGKEKGLLVQANDITERRLAEEATLKAAREEAARARDLIQSLRRQIEEDTTFHNMVSRSPAMKEIFRILPEVAETTATVLICGESGTGKELIAQSLHELSQRKDGPFVAINCSALPDSLLESELFGYKAGAFTDARRDKPGKFAAAEGGTIFLDEIGDISPAMQAKLLRVLQERVYEPLGSTWPERADVRVIAATNKDLKLAVERGTFRQDLYYRINVLSVTLPALRERRCDIPLLADHFVSQYNARYKKDIEGISNEAINQLLAYNYPGNIRELENIIEHSFIFCKGSTIEPNHLPDQVTARKSVDPETLVLARVKNFEDLERLYIQSVLAETGGNKLAAARKLGIHKTTFFRKLKKLKINSGDGSKPDVT